MKGGCQAVRGPDVVGRYREGTSPLATPKRAGKTSEARCAAGTRRTVETEMGGKGERLMLGLQGWRRGGAVQGSAHPPRVWSSGEVPAEPPGRKSVE